MKRFIQRADRSQGTLFPEQLDDCVAEDNPVRVIDVFVEQLDLGKLGFDGDNPLATGRPAYRHAVLFKRYIYGCLNRIQSSRRGTRKSAQSQPIWLIGRLRPDFKTIANVRKDNGSAIRKVCRQLNLLTQATVAIDNSKFNVGHDRNRLANMAKQAKIAMETSDLNVVADRGCFSGEEIRQCQEFTVYVS